MARHDQRRPILVCPNCQQDKHDQCVNPGLQKFGRPGFCECSKQHNTVKI